MQRFTINGRTVKLPSSRYEPIQLAEHDSKAVAESSRHVHMEVVSSMKILLGK